MYRVGRWCLEKAAVREELVSDVSNTGIREVNGRVKYSLRGTSEWVNGKVALKKELESGEEY